MKNSKRCESNKNERFVFDIISCCKSGSVFFVYKKLCTTFNFKQSARILLNAQQECT